MTRPACSPRWATARNPERATHGGKVALIAEALGTPFMDWQRQVADVALEVDPRTGLLAYRTVIVSVPRQQGKTTLLLPLWLQRAVSWPGQRISWTMQSAKDAREKWEDEHVPQVEASPLRKAVRKVRKTNGSEAVLFHNGSIQTLMASTASSGHGKVLDLGIVDEAFAQTDDRLEQAMRPAMKTRNRPGLPGAQMWLVSTMGVAESTWFHGWCSAGRQAAERGDPSPVAYFEWSAPDDCDPGDPDVWWSCMPALGTTVTEDTIREEYEQAVLTEDGLPGFRRQALNQQTMTKGDPVFPHGKWEACTDVRSLVKGRLVLAVEVSSNRQFASVGASDGRHVELVEHRPNTGWVASRVEELVRRHRPGMVLVDGSGPAGALVDALRAEVGSLLVEVPAKAMAAACGQMFDAVVAGDVRHLGQPDLDLAVAGATKRPRGDAWVWDRRSSTVDVSPLSAVTLARWGAVAPAESKVPNLW